MANGSCLRLDVREGLGAASKSAAMKPRACRLFPQKRGRKAVRGQVLPGVDQGLPGSRKQPLRAAVPT